MQRKLTFGVKVGMYNLILVMKFDLLYTNSFYASLSWVSYSSGLTFDARQRSWRSVFNFINVLRAKLLCALIPREQNRLTTWLSFFPFQDLQLQKRLIEHWWNWHQVSIASTFYEQLLHADPKSEKKCDNLVSSFVLRSWDLQA